MRLLPLVGVVIACGDSPTPTETPPVTTASFDLDLPNDIQVGQPFQLTITAVASNGARPHAAFNATVTLSPSSGSMTPASAAMSNGVAVVQAVLNGASGTVSIEARAGNVTGSRAITVLEAASPSASLITAGPLYSCALTDDGAAYCWGSYGALGNPEHENRVLVPSPVVGGLQFASLDAGDGHACGVSVDGAGYCWGFNGHGQLGNGSTEFSVVPVAVSGGHTWTSVTAGAAHTCGIRSDGAAFCWGNGAGGSLGSNTVDDSAVPLAVAGGLEFRHLSAGDSYTCGVTTDDRAYCWGWIGHRLGHGSTTDHTTEPVEVVGGHSWSVVEASQHHTCGLTTAGTAYCWGMNNGGQLGNGERGFGTESAVPSAVGGGLQFAAISPGDNFTCGVTIDGAAYCWGSNLSGQLGTGSSDTQPVLGPVAVAGELGFASISAGRAHTCGTTVDGDAYCWGWNAEGQLGIGDRSDRRQPSRVEFP